jgi:CMP-N-acetylneuraminic acid synthetase
MKIAALIPARKGSKRMPNKNRLDIDGDMFIDKVLRNLGKSKFNIDLFVSTDDNFLKDNIKTSVNFLEREDQYCDDFATVTDLTKWHFQNVLQDYDIVIQMYIHSICINSSVIDDGLTKMIESPKSNLISIARLDGPVEWTFKIEGNELRPNFPNKRNERSQDLGVSYIDAGQFYIYKKEWLKNSEDNEYDDDCAWHEIPTFQSNDLDENADLDKLLFNYHYSSNLFSDLS